MVSLLEKRGNIGRTRPPFILVAASDAPEWVKRQAHYVCNGTDDHTEINSAITALPSDGGTVLLSVGTFNINDHIHLKDKVTLAGSGWGTLLSAQQSKAGIRGASGTNAADDVAIRDLFLQGSGDIANDGDVDRSGIYMNDSDRVQVIHCRVTQMVYDGIVWGANSNDWIVAFNLVEGGGSHASAGDDGINPITTGSTALIIGNIVKNITDDGIHDSGGKGIIIKGNYITGCGKAGIQVGAFDRDADVVIDGNYITGCTENGILFGGDSSGTHTLRGIISNNIMEGGGDGTTSRAAIDVQVPETTTTITYISVTGNVVRGFNGRGINFVGLSAKNIVNAVCKGNQIVDNGASVGIRAERIDLIIMDGNQVVNAATSSLSIDNVTTAHVTNNQVDSTNGVGLGTITNLVIRQNTGDLVTEKNGNATVASGSTSVAVTHGLDRTPALEDISVTPTNNLGNAAKFWTSNPTSTQFTINVDADPGASTATFVWMALVL